MNSRSRCRPAPAAPPLPPFSPLPPPAYAPLQLRFPPHLPHSRHSEYVHSIFQTGGMVDCGFFTWVLLHVGYSQLLSESKI